MRLLAAASLCLLATAAAAAGPQHTKTYSWVDEDGVRHYGDSVPPEYADAPKQVLNEQGISIDELQGKKTPEQIAQERRQAELEQQKELQHRADQALLATYNSVDEIEMHRDRRLELFQAQARVTELYLKNLRRRLDQLKGVASRYKPYSTDEDAEVIDPGLVDEIKETEAAITRHEDNLAKYRSEEADIRRQFEGDINRFMVLKGLTASNGQAVPE